MNRLAALIVGLNDLHPFCKMFGTRLTQRVRDHFTDETATYSICPIFTPDLAAERVAKRGGGMNEISRSQIHESQSAT